MGSEGLSVCQIFNKLKIAKYFKPLPRLRLLFFCIVIYSIFITTVQANESLFGRPVAEIEVLGNKITQARFVIRWSRIEIGQSLNQEMLDLALFGAPFQPLENQVLLLPQRLLNQSTLTDSSAPVHDADGRSVGSDPLAQKF